MSLALICPTVRRQPSLPNWRWTLIVLVVTAVTYGLEVRFTAQADVPKPPATLKEQPAVEANPGDDGEEGPRVRAEAVDQEAVRLRELGQRQFVQGSYDAMAKTYSSVCERPSSTVDDYMWFGHAHQLARNWPAACEAYQGALAKLDLEIATTDAELRRLDELVKRDESIKFQKGSKYPFLKRAQEQFPKQWPELVLYLGHLQLTAGKNPAAAAKTLSKGLRFEPELAVPLEQLQSRASAVWAKQVKPVSGIRSIETITPLETQRYLAIAQEQLGQPAAAFDIWVRLRLCQMLYQVFYANTDPAHLKELASKLPQDALQPPHVFALQNPDREIIKKHEAKDFLKSGAANPFHATPLPGFDFTRSGPAAASVTKLPDGRLIMAHASGNHHLTGIKLAQSKDGVNWDAPWDFAHNNTFNTRAPSLVVDDNGEIWMLCLSQRLTTQRFASAPYQLWLTHSKDGREWSPLRVVQIKSDSPQPQIAASQYQEIPQLLRLPGSRFGIIWRDLFGSAKSPGEIETVSKLPLPLDNNQPIVSNTHATFESNGRCHLVFDDFGRGLYYTRSDDLQTWLPLQNLGLAEKNSSISMPQLLIEGEHVALIHERNNGSWLLRGTIAPVGLTLGTPLQIASHPMPLNGSRLKLDGDRVLILAGDEPYVPNLLTASFADLVTPP